MSLSLSRKALILVTVPVVFELGLVSFLANALNRAEDARRQENRAREFSSHLNNIMSMHLQRTAFLVLGNNAPSPDLDTKIAALKHKMWLEFQAINKLSAEDPTQREQWRMLMVLANNLDTTFTLAKLYYKNDDKSAAAVEFARVQNYLQQLIHLSDKLNADQAAIFNERHQELLRSGQAVQTALWTAVLGSVLLAFGLLFYFNRGTSDRLRTIMRNTELLAVGKPPERSLSGDDELAAIDSLYHRMHASLTSLRERERTILDNAAEIICSIDDDLRFSDVNNAVKKLWLYEPQDILGKRIVDCIYKDDQKKVVDALREMIKQKPGKKKAAEVEAKTKTEVEEINQLTRFEARVERSDGTVSDTEWSATFSAETNSLCCVIHDISERKEIDRLKQEFVAMVSHDLRAPLTSIQMVHSMIEQDLESVPDLSEYTMRNLTIARDNVNRLMALINNLLDLDKLESGMMTLLPDQEPLLPRVQSAVDALGAIAQRHKIKVQVDIPPEAEAYFDGEKVIQIIVNLLSNAFKFSPPQSTVTISARPINNDFARIEVKDQGRGVPDNMQQKIFERFSQTRSEDGRNHKGSGLGLAICKAIAERHNGQIGVRSEAGRGSVFWFTLPLDEQSFLRAGHNKNTV